jgi:HEAT repeat protein
MRKVFFPAVVLAAALIAAFAFRATRPSKLARPDARPDATEARGLAASASIEGAPAALPGSWPIGARHRYSIEAHLEFGSSPSGDGPAMAATWTGTLDAVVLDRSAEVTEVGYAIEKPSFKVRGGGVTRAVPLVEQSLATNFNASYDARGRLRDVRLPAGVGEDTQPLLRGLLASMQFTAPEGSATEWSSRELDAAGEYAATYRKLDPLGRYSRRKERYLRIVGPTGLTTQGANAQVVSGASAVFTMGSDGRLAALELSENGGVRVDSKTVQFDSHVRLRVQLLERSQASRELIAARARLEAPSTAPWLAPTQVSRSQDSDRERVKGADLKQLLDELDRLAPSAQQERAALQGRLSSLFRVEPRAVDEAISRLRKNDPNAAMLTATLAGADTPETQKALARFAAESGIDPEARSAALVSLTQVDHPEPTLMADLKPLLSNPDAEVARQAALAIGAASNRTATHDPAVAKAANADLLDGFQRANTDEDRIWALLAIGNAGSPDSLDLIRTQLRSANVALREAAAQALRNVPGPEADSLLITTMRLDPSAEVRRAAVFTARYRSGEAILAALAVVCREDLDESVRGVAIETIGGAELGPAALELLQWSAEHDPSEQNRRAARALLERAFASEGI